MVDPKDPEDRRLINAAESQGKGLGAAYWAADPQDRTPDIKGCKNPRSFQNVLWNQGLDRTDLPDGEWEDSDFTQNPLYVPGRWERMPDGSVRDQAWKLVVRLTDANGNRKVILNYPPRDWDDKETITALNKRQTQQIRRWTDKRLRDVVVPYAQQERQWILDNLNKDAKPTTGTWKAFTERFNAAHQGKTLQEAPLQPRPERTTSSITKEVARFAKEYYSKGRVPNPNETAAK